MNTTYSVPQKFPGLFTSSSIFGIGCNSDTTERNGRLGGIRLDLNGLLPKTLIKLLQKNWYCFHSLIYWFYWYQILKKSELDRKFYLSNSPLRSVQAKMWAILWIITQDIISCRFRSGMIIYWAIDPHNVFPGNDAKGITVIVSFDYKAGYSGIGHYLNFFQIIGFSIDDPLQMQYFGDNFDFLCLYLIVIIYKISIEQALFVSLSIF